MTTPLVKFKKALETLALHEKHEYHKDSYTKTVAFLEYMSGSRQSIDTQLDTSYAAQIQKNRKVLKSIMATVEVCGRQGIALTVTAMMEITLTIVTIILGTSKFCFNFDVVLVTVC